MEMLRDVFEVTDRTWRGIGMIPQSGWRLSERYARVRRRARASTVSDIHTDESPLCRSGEVLQGLIKPHECAAFGKECTPRNPLGATMVSSEGACAAYYTYRRLELVDAETRRWTPMSDDLDFEGWVCPVPLRDTPTDRDGPRRRRRDVGRADRAPVPARVRRRPRGRARRLGGAARSAGGRLAFSTDSFVVKPMFFPGGSIGDLAVNGTVNDLAMSGATPAVPVDRVHPAGGHRAGRPRPDRRGHGRGRADAAGVRLVTGDTKVVDSGSGDGVYINTAGIGVIADGVDIGPRRAAARRRRADQRRHRRARRRGDELPRGPRVRHRRSRATPRRCTGWSPRCSPPAPTCTSCATRPAAASSATLNEIARASGVGIDLVERDLPDPGRRSATRAACSASTRCRWPTRASWWRSCRPSAPTRCWPPCGPTRSARRRARIGTCVAEHPGMVVARTALGGTRVVDLPIGEQLPRIC